jgi:organic radical activating enzyme
MGRYGIKDVFVTVQGEGLRAGTKAVFVRFTGCNLWDGNPLHRDRGAGSCARWCDTDFFKGAVMETEELLTRMGELWPGEGERWCVLTGGEPCLQVDVDLMAALHNEGWKVAIETNGTEENDAVLDADHICVAPKLDAKGDPLSIVLRRAHEVKIVLPGAAAGEPGWTPVQLLAMEHVRNELWPGAVLFVQPQDPIVSPNFVEETALKRTKEVTADVDDYLDTLFTKAVQKCTAWVIAHPNWRVSLQTHKFIGMP